MAKSSKTASAAFPTLPPEQALRLLQMQYDKGKGLLDRGGISIAEDQAWVTTIEETLR